MLRKIARRINYWRSKPQPLKTAVADGLQLTGLSRFLLIKCELYTMRFFPDSSIAHSLWRAPDGRKKETRLLKAYLRPGDVVVDIGANVGSFTLASASLVGPSGMVVSVEPHPTTFDHLRENVSLNRFKNICLYNCAAGETSDKLYFSEERNDALRHIVPHSKLEVPVETLDDLLEKHDVEAIRLLKIDVQGFEEAVLKGAARSLSVTHCIYIETDDTCLKDYGTSTTRLFSILRSYGFELYRLGTDLKNVMGIQDIADFMDRAGDLKVSKVDGTSS